MSRGFAEEETHDVCKVCDYAIRNEECPGCGFSFESFSIKEHDAAVRAEEQRKTIEKCAEVLAKIIDCKDCPIDCGWRATEESCKKSVALYFIEQMNGEEE